MILECKNLKMLFSNSGILTQMMKLKSQKLPICVMKDIDSYIPNMIPIISIVVVLTWSLPLVIGAHGTLGITSIPQVSLINYQMFVKAKLSEMKQQSGQKPWMEVQWLLTFYLESGLPEKDPGLTQKVVTTQIH